MTDHASSNEPRFMNLIQEAQAESDRLSVKIKSAYDRIRQAGGHIGTAPFGYEAYHDNHGIRRLRCNPQEQSVISEIRTVFNEYVLQGIPNALYETVGFVNLDSASKCRGKPWTARTLLKILKQ